MFVTGHASSKGKGNNTFIPRRIGRIGNERHRKQGGGRVERGIQHGLARIDVHMGYSKVDTMGWDWPGLWQLPMGWYTPGVGGERMTVRYTVVLEQLAVVRGVRPLG